MQTNQTEQEKCESEIRAQGIRDGAAAGSWVIDGNTHDDVCRAILQGLDDGDPMVTDSLPTLQLGQWADDPSFEEILLNLAIEPDEDEIDDLFMIYSDAWYEGMVAEVERSCRARLGKPSAAVEDAYAYLRTHGFMR